MKFDIIKTNIANVAADAIVLPANEHLKEGPGASAAIFEAAGRKKLTKACAEIGHCEVGSSIPTLGFDLNAKYIVHAVVPRWIDGEHGEYDLLSSAYVYSLRIADIMGCESIAFPLLASGNNGFDKELAVQIAKESIEQFSGTNLTKVLLIVYGDHAESLVKSMGYTVLSIPEQVYIDEKKAKQNAKMKKLFAEGKDVAQKILEDQVSKAVVWLKEEENRKKALNVGISIARFVLSKDKEIPKK